MINALRISALLLSVTFALIASYIMPKGRVVVPAFDLETLTESQLSKLEQQREQYRSLRRSIPYWITCAAFMALARFLSAY
jgi:hypothetical protein